MFEELNRKNDKKNRETRASLLLLLFFPPTFFRAVKNILSEEENFLVFASGLKGEENEIATRHRDL